MVNEFVIRKIAEKNLFKIPVNTSNCYEYHVTGIPFVFLTVFNFPVKFQSHYLQNFKFAVF